jgi:hypothetical protein
MNPDRPMNEYEGALYEAVRVLGLAIIEMGGNRLAIQAGLEEMRDAANGHGEKNGAAILDHLCRALSDAPVAYQPAKPN